MAVIFGQPWRMQAVMRRRRPEIQMWIVVAHQQRIAGDLVARPFADDRGGEIADVVVVEAQHRAEIGRSQRFLRAPAGIYATGRIDTLFKIDPECPGAGMARSQL